jgi:hypothetical protein
MLINRVVLKKQPKTDIVEPTLLRHQSTPPEERYRDTTKAPFLK